MDLLFLLDLLDNIETHFLDPTNNINYNTAKNEISNIIVIIWNNKEVFNDCKGTKIYTSPPFNK